MGLTENLKPTERRHAPRDAMQINVVMRQVGYHSVAAKLTEASIFGYRITAMMTAGPGAHFWVRIPGMESLLSSLCWSNGRVHGLSFNTPLHPAVLRRLRGDQWPSPDAGSLVEANTANDQRIEPGNPDESRRTKIMRGEMFLPSLLKRKEPKLNGEARLTGLIGRRNGRVTDHRGEQRFAAPDEGVSVRVGEKLVEVEEISSSGIRILADLGSHGIGAKVPVRFDGFAELAGRIVWIRDGKAGPSLPPDSIDLMVA